MTGKMDILELVQDFPDELTFDEVVRRLAELYTVPPKLLSPERSGNLTWGATFALRKSRVHEALQLLPDQLSGDDAIDDAIDRLYVVFRIESGLAEADEGKGIPHEEAMRRFAEWRP